MNDKVILTCSECLSRNYTTTRNKKTHSERLELNKFCKKCGKKTVHKETKQEAYMLKWFSIEGIMTEVKRIRWPRKKDMISNTGRVLFFCLLLAAFFMLCEVGVAGVLKLIGIGA